MPEAPTWLPALTLHLQLKGLDALGLDSESVRARLGPLPTEPEALVPAQTYLDMWDEAERLYGLPGLPTALALAIPFGAYGALDYLAGSADTVAGSCESAMLHLSMVAVDVGLEIDSLEDGAHVVRVQPAGALPPQASEFTLATVFCRLRHITGGHFVPRTIGLPGARPASDTVRHRLLGLAPTYMHPTAEMIIDSQGWRLPVRSADPYLHAALESIAVRLHLTQPRASTLERAVRARLRGVLAQGRPDAARMARLLGVSERTLQRRLKQLGRRFSDVVEDFRREEATRLLATPGLNLIEVAASLGYAEQASFTRAFRRWTGTTPGVWRAKQLA